VDFDCSLVDRVHVKPTTY